MCREGAWVELTAQVTSVRFLFEVASSVFCALVRDPSRGGSLFFIILHHKRSPGRTSEDLLERRIL